jgi:hypothetical protein
MEISLEAATLGIPLGHYARSRGAQVLELGTRFGLQSLVLERQTSGCRHLVGQGRVVEQTRTVGQQRHVLSSADERSHLAVEHECATEPVDQSAVVQAVGDLHRWVAQHVGKLVAKAAGRRRRRCLDDEARDRGTSVTGAKPSPHDSCRERDQRASLPEPEIARQGIGPERAAVEAGCEDPGDEPEINRGGNEDGQEQPAERRGWANEPEQE